MDFLLAQFWPLKDLQLCSSVPLAQKQGRKSEQKFNIGRSKLKTN
jgi:hypothetical protein